MATDWALEVFKVAGTGLSVFIGAALAFRYAETGRRNDVYYKKRFDSYLMLSGNLIGMSMYANLVLGILDRTVEERHNYLFDLRERDNIARYLNGMNNYLNHEGYAATRIMSFKAREDYMQITHLVVNVIGILHSISSGEYDNKSNEDKLAIVVDLKIRIDDFTRKLHAWIDTNVVELDIPNVRRVLGTQAERIHVVNPPKQL